VKVKLKDIADELHISVAAVSMAINGKRGVSDATRKEVLDLAKTYGYETKVKTIKTIKTQGMRRRYIKLLRIKKHGLVAADTAFFSKLIEGIEEEIKKMNGELLVSNVKVEELNNEWIDFENKSEIDGIIILATELVSKDIDLLNKLNKPFVVLDNSMNDQDWNCILMNNEHAMQKGMKHLIQKGHRHIGYLKSSHSICNFDERFMAYLSIVEKETLEKDQGNIICLEPTLDGAYEDMMKVLNQKTNKNFPTAFMADNDLIAVGAMKALMEKGYLVPQDISIVGIDDMPCGTIIHPKLTTVRIYKKEIGKLAVDRLLSLCENDQDISRKILINTMLIERGSVIKAI